MWYGSSSSDCGCGAFAVNVIRNVATVTTAAVVAAATVARCLAVTRAVVAPPLPLLLPLLSVITVVLT